MRKIFIFLLFCISAIWAKPIVTATILPTKYFIERIAADTLEVNVMVGRGADPHTYEPKPKQMSDLERSELYFAVGIEFDEVWLPKFKSSYPKLKFISTQDGIKRIQMSDDHAEHMHEHGDHKHEAHEHEKDDHHGHDHHGHGHHDHDAHHHAHGEHHHGEHSHDGLDPHIWLDPILVKTQAQNIADALIAKFPQNAEIYRANLAKFHSELDELDAFIKNELKGIKKREFIVYHPSWGYFANRYDLTQIAIEIEGKEPKPKELSGLIEEAKEHKVSVIFVAPQFSKKAAGLIAKEVGASVEQIDQLPENWDDEMRKMVRVLAKSLK